MIKPLTLREVLPSALLITTLGFALTIIMDTPWTALGVLGWWSLPTGIMLGIAMYGLAFLLTCSPMMYTSSMRELMELLHSMFRKFTWFDIVLISILAGVGEELLIRGAVQTWLVSQSTPLTGIAVASILFGLMHYIRPVYIAVTMFIGALFGVVLHLSNSIILVVLAHIVYDLLAFFIIVKRPHLLGLKSADEKQLLVKESL